jgi:hypothetical protein
MIPLSIQIYILIISYNPTPPLPFQSHSNLVQMPHRLYIMFPPPEHIIHTSNNQHTPKHDHTPVHIRHIRRVDDGEETRDTRHCHIHYREHVDGHAELAEGEARGWEWFGAEAFLEDAVGMG